MGNFFEGVLCRNEKQSSEPEKMPPKGNLLPLRQGNLFVRRYITFVKASTARAHRSKQSRSVFLKHIVPA
jgi:hypothetical protein